jgi:uncharacterized membrane protein YfcA
VLTGWLGLIAAGFCLGFLGAGGTSVSLPVLVYGLQLRPHEAVAASLVLVGGTSGIGAAWQGVQGLVRWRMAIALAPFGLLGAALGARGSYLLSEVALLRCFGLLLILIAVRLWHDSARDARGLVHRAPLAASCLGIGLLTGALGNGGGFLLVPVLAKYGGLPWREAMATSLAISFLNCAVAFAGHSGQQTLSARLLLGMLAVATAGLGLGVAAARRAEPQRLKKWFAALLALLGLWMLVDRRPQVEAARTAARISPVEGWPSLTHAIRPFGPMTKTDRRTISQKPTPNFRATRPPRSTSSG